VFQKCTLHSTILIEPERCHVTIIRSVLLNGNLSDSHINQRCLEKQIFCSLPYQAVATVAHQEIFCASSRSHWTL